MARAVRAPWRWRLAVACRRCPTDDGAAFPHSAAPAHPRPPRRTRSEEHTSELQSLMRISYAVFCLKKKIDVYQYQNIREIDGQARPGHTQLARLQTTLI